MDFNGPSGYKSMHLKIWRLLRHQAAKMENEFIELMDQVNELLAPNDLLDDDILICECFSVNVADIRQLLSDTRSVDLDVLAHKFGMGEGCRTCIKNSDWVKKIF